MAIIGYEGIVELSREWPAPTVLADSRLQRGASPSLDLTDQAFLSGDQVVLIALRGVPLGVGTAGLAPCPDGHAFWADGATAVGPALAARTAGGAFWSANSSLPFWESAATTGFTQSVVAFASRDELDDVRFYSNEIDAINGGAQGLIPMRNVSPGTMLIVPATKVGESMVLATLSGVALVTLSGETLVTLGGDTLYLSAALQLLQSIGNASIQDGEQPAENLAPIPQAMLDAAASVDNRGWLMQCDLTNWVFETDVTQLDETAIGQAFGESAKGMLRGAGSFSAVISHEFISGSNSSVGMLRLVMLTNQGSKARARFQIASKDNSGLSSIRERLFYETDILLNRASVNTQFDDVIRISSDFVATGRIRLAKES
jgi:hypothetical protein